MINNYSDNEQPELTAREQWLLEQINAVIAGQEGSQADDPIVTFSHWLIQAQSPVNETVQEQLREQCLFASMANNQEVKMKNNSRKRSVLFRWRWAITAVCFVIILGTGLILVTPAGRAWAQSFLARSGPVIVTDRPTLPEQALTRTPAPQPTTPPLDQTQIIPDMLDPLEASKQAGFAVFVPTYVPPGYELLRIQPMPAANEVDLEYHAPAEPDGYFVLRQIFFQPPEGAEETFEWPVGDAPVVELTVRGQPAIWVEQSNQGLANNEAGEPVPSTWNMFMWQEGEFLFWFFSKNLSLEETVKIAESLTPVEVID